MKVKIIFFTTIACLWTFVSLAAQRPNVVLIMCDDLNDYISGMGSHPQVRTPNLEEFAKSAVAFKRAYSNNPVCAPSRASIFTGIYPHQSKNLFSSNDNDDDGNSMLEDITSSLSGKFSSQLGVDSEQSGGITSMIIKY